MPSSWSPSLRFELQFTGENINLWGDKLNAALTRVDNAIAGWTTKALTGNYVLSTANGAADEARSAMLKFTGAGPFTVTIPSVSKSYVIWNACSADLTISTGAGQTATLVGGELCSVVCDGANVKRVGFQSMQAQRLQNLGDPTAGQDAATKQYVDNTAWSYNAGSLPGQAGNNGKFLTTDGATASWANAFAGPIITSPTITGGADLTGGLSVAGGFVLSGSSRANVQAVSAAAIDLSVADYFVKAISANTSFTFNNVTALKAQAFVLDLTISNSAVPSWPTSVKWSDGSNPSNSLGNGRHILAFITTDGGTSWVGLVGAFAVA